MFTDSGLRTVANPALPVSSNHASGKTTLNCIGPSGVCNGAKDLTYNSAQQFWEVPMYIPIWALVVILILFIWAVATRASRNYAQSIGVALSQAVRELADTTNSYKNDLKDEVRDLRNQIDRLRSEAETATNNLQVDVGSQEKKMCSMRADIISLESRVQTKRRHYPDDFPPP